MVELENYFDFEEVVKKFWECNIKQDYKEFDFEEAFDSLKAPIKRKLSEHGLNGYENYKELEEEIYNYDCLKELEQITDYINIDKEDLKNAIIKYKYERNKTEFEGFDAFEKLEELLNKINNREGLDRFGLVALFDEMIHAQHETGNIFDDVDLTKLKAEFEEEYK